nr:hypothetical protein [Burkholderia multivorans]
MRRQRGAHEFHRFVDDRADVYRLPRRRAAAAECQDALDQQPCPFPGFQHLLDVAVRGRVGCDAGERAIAESENRGEDVVEVVRDAAGERAKRFELLRLAQLPFQAVSRFFVGQALRDVLDGGDDQVFRVRIGRLMCRKHTRDAHVGPHHAAVAVHVALLESDAVLAAHQLVDVRLREGPIIGVRDVRCASLGKFAIAVADHPLKRGVRHQVAVVRTQHQDSDRRVLEHRAPALFARAHCPVRVFETPHVRDQHIHQQNHAQAHGADAERRVVRKGDYNEEHGQTRSQHHGPVASRAPQRSVIGRVVRHRRSVLLRQSGNTRGCRSSRAACALRRQSRRATCVAGRARTRQVPAHTGVPFVHPPAALNRVTGTSST